MSTEQLKASLHLLIEQMSTTESLEDVYRYIRSRTNHQDIWEKLSEEEQARVMKSYAESYDPSMLIAHEDVEKYLKP